jgi:SAM-dependent methyltransferase
LYAESRLDYGAELENLQRTYGGFLARLAGFGIPRGALLDIGCGNGFVLKAAQALGFQSTWGVEPSREAVATAEETIRPSIVCAEMRADLFPPASFDVICLFQVLDHVRHPGELADLCIPLLKPGGVVVCLTHNVEALSARILGERSPIFDIEHTCLFSPKTIRRLFSDHGFQPLASGSAWNRYSLHYLTRLVPLPADIKNHMLAYLHNHRLGRMGITVPLGNLYLVAQKPK